MKKPLPLQEQLIKAAKLLTRHGGTVKLPDPPRPKKSNYSFHIEEAAKKALDAAAKKQRTSTSDLVNTLVKAWLKRQS